MTIEPHPAHPEFDEDFEKLVSGKGLSDEFRQHLVICEGCRLGVEANFRQRTEEIAEIAESMRRKTRDSLNKDKPDWLP